MNIATRQVVLIGMMGSGKTTCGRLLAKRLGWGFWDCDEALLEATGSTAAAAAVQRSRGQGVLHAIEHRLLRGALLTLTDTVFAAPGSVVLRPAVLSGALTVWLRASAIGEQQNIAHSGQHHRPLPEDPIAVLQEMSAARLPAYERLADITVDVDSDPTVTCDRVMQALAMRAK
ncbi:MAG: shikimate kinase [Solirubrobacteraceae bacterium]